MMSFVRKDANPNPIVDTVFAVAMYAMLDKQENGDLVTDATIGSLFDEDGNFVAFHSVFDHYDALDHRIKGAYAASFLGNPDFCRDVYNWVTQGTELSLAHSVIATPGGSGAISSAITSFLDKGETIILPDIGWSSYELMAAQYNINFTHYQMFDGDRFNLASVKEALVSSMNTQGRAVLVINDPCHNPTGYSLTMEEWEELVRILNEVSARGPVILIDDIAYIDYAYDGAHSRAYMNTFNQFSDNVMAVIAFSCSKALTSYGLRCGAAVILAQKQEAVREAEIVFEKTARAIWSNIPNAAMANFSWVVNENRDAYLAEKQQYIDLLKQRSSLFLKEAEACGLPLYPYKEGFFITIKVDPAKTEAIHEALMRDHIYTVTMPGGIRVAVCSLPLRKTSGLAERILQIINTVE